MKYGFYALVSRMKNINRWALMRNSSAENVQEHSHMTAVLAHALAVIGRDIFGKDLNPAAAAAAALFHDAPEIITGDMPTPVKYYDADMISAYKRVEEKAAFRLLRTLPGELQSSYEELLIPRNGETIKYVKAADKLAAYIKCLEELKTGNGEFRLAASQTKEKLDALQMPEISYFMENFVHAFEMTLDEINI